MPESYLSSLLNYLWSLGFVILSLAFINNTYPHLENRLVHLWLTFPGYSLTTIFTFPFEIIFPVCTSKTLPKCFNIFTNCWMHVMKWKEDFVVIVAVILSWNFIFEMKEEYKARQDKIKRGRGREFCANAKSLDIKAFPFNEMEPPNLILSLC